LIQNMQRSSLLVFILFVGVCAVACLPKVAKEPTKSGGVGGVGGVGEKEEKSGGVISGGIGSGGSDVVGDIPKFIPLGDRSMKMKSISYSTKDFFNSYLIHDFSGMMRFVDKQSLILINTLLPTSGIYAGKRGFVQSMDRCYRTAAITNADFRVLFVDEARTTSVVEVIYSGVYRHNNVSFDDMKAMFFIKWNMGKIAKMNIVDVNPQKTYSLFLTKANKQFNKLMEAMYMSGVESIDRYLADDITISCNNIYPVSLLVPPAKATAGDADAAPSYEGKDLIVTLKGKENAMKLTKFANKLYFNLTTSIKVLYSDESTVVAAKILKPTTRLFLPLNQKSYWNGVTIMYTINRFDDRGMLKEVKFLINRPLLPHQIRNANDLLDLAGEPSLMSLLAPLRSAITIQPASRASATSH